MKKLLTLIYGVISYASFVSVFTYTIFFIGNILVTPSLDAPGSSNTLNALLINASLLGIFALQHSIMARPAFKRWWMRIVPQPAERSTYVLASTICLAAIVYFWQPLGGVIWQLTDPLAIGVIYSLFALGWALLFAASFQINHFDLFGLRQVWLYFRGQSYTELPFKKPLLYRYVRHPLYLGLFIGIWATPTMTVAHLVFATLCTAYVVIGVRFEEHDLGNALPEYQQYKMEVPMFFPNLNRSSS